MGDRGGTATGIATIGMLLILYPMGDRGGTATVGMSSQLMRLLYPMGDRGGTATPRPCSPGASNYTRWEIGGEPQQVAYLRFECGDYTRWEIGGEPQRTRLNRKGSRDYTRWEIGGEPQPPPYAVPVQAIIPDGRSGGNRNWNVSGPVIERIIPDGRSGGNRNYHRSQEPESELYPMGDRGGTATARGRHGGWVDYTRWEIGGEPQRRGRLHQPPTHYTRWEIGGEPQQGDRSVPAEGIIPDGRSGGNRNNDMGGRRYGNYTRWEIGGNRNM